jgi:hypothetical protein
LSPEGIVLGADSTTTILSNNGQPHFYNHAQKLFEIGSNSTFGAVTWGLGGLDDSSYRRLFALLGDDIKINPPTSVLDVVTRWIDLFWPIYSQTTLYTITNLLAVKPAAGSGLANERTSEEEQIFANLQNNVIVGFCLAGYVESDRVPSAYVTYSIRCKQSQHRMQYR